MDIGNIHDEVESWSENDIEAWQMEINWMGTKGIVVKVVQVSLVIIAECLGISREIASLREAAKEKEKTHRKEKADILVKVDMEDKEYKQGKREKGKAKARSSTETAMLVANMGTVQQIAVGSLQVSWVTKTKTLTRSSEALKSTGRYSVWKLKI